MAKFLDDNGLLYLWSKIKAIVPTKTSQITNDSGYITTADIPEGAAASTTTPKMAGTAATGSEKAFARGDHVHPSDTTKVDKVSGKGLSTNDLTNTLKSNYDAAYTHSQTTHAPAGAQANVLESVKVNGTALAISSKTVNVTVPTKTSDITNDSGFITAAAIPDVYTKSEVDAKLTSAVKYKGTKTNYSDLPTSGNVTGDMWNITNASSANGIKAGDNVVWNGTAWDVQSGAVDLSGCVQNSDTITNAEIDTIVAS